MEEKDLIEQQAELDQQTGKVSLQFSDSVSREIYGDSNNSRNRKSIFLALPRFVFNVIKSILGFRFKW